LYGWAFDSADVSGVLASPDPSSKSSKEDDSGDIWNVLLGVTPGEHGFHIVKGLDEPLPMVPVALPLIGICSHKPSINVSPCSSEKSMVLSLLMNWKRV
jgi:hypothetical protein